MTEQPETEPAAKREAVIFVPGLLAQDGGDQTADKIGQRIANALNVEARDPRMIFSVSAGIEESVTEDSKVRIVSVSVREHQKSPDTVLLDVFQLDYAQSFRKAASQRPPIVQAVIVAALVLFNLHRVVISLFTRSKSIGHRLQALWGLFFLMMMMVYVGALGYASYDAVRSARNAITKPAATVSKPGATPAPAEKSTAAAGIEAMVLVLTALGLTTRASLKDTIYRVGVETSGALGYVAYGWREGSMAGAVAKLVDYIFESAEKRSVDYTAVHIICYSFGSVIALDALFPSSGEPPESAKNVRTLTTIGCPFDFIRSYWPSYFKGRGGFSKVPQEWLNIYRDDDVLASNFTDEHFGGSTERGIEGSQPCSPKNERYGRPGSIGFSGIVMAGFRAHSAYWERGEMYDRSAFNSAVKFIFEGRYPLKSKD